MSRNAEDTTPPPETTPPEAPPPGAAAPDPGAPPRQGRIARLQARLVRERERLEGMRPGSPWVEIGFRILERDVRIVGTVLGGGLAYRLFFWTIAFAVFSAGLLGFASAEGSDIRGTALDGEMGDSLARTISDAAQQSENGRWWLLAVGLFSVTWFAWSLLRALRLVHGAAWGLVPEKRSPPPLGVLGVLAVPVLLVILSWLTGWIRGTFGVLPGLMGHLIAAACIALLYVVVCSVLPTPRDVPLSAHVPGALMFVLVLETLLIGAQWYLAEKLASSTALYGALGLATTMLFTLYLLGRLLVWSFELNAVTWQVLTERDAQSFLTRWEGGIRRGDAEG